jgi:hypothetical protein|tara:strand:- start:297 stop:485 length:189 start_codon:yes stop_codon:yes gene_type:complete
MYQLNLKLTNKQYNLLTEALFFFSEEKSEVNVDAVEELQDCFDRGSKKIETNTKRQGKQQVS